MKLALYKMTKGEPTKVPLRISWHVIAARYGTTPADVREWPADDFIDALAFIGVTGG